MRVIECDERNDRDTRWKKFVKRDIDSRYSVLEFSRLSGVEEVGFGALGGRVGGVRYPAQVVPRVHIIRVIFQKMSAGYHPPSLGISGSQR